jgi:serine/threonine protein phosphatase PrpC
MRIEVGPPLKLTDRDTVLLATDGLFDNLTLAEIIEAIRKDPLSRLVPRLIALCQHRMSGTDEGHPSKPDDLTMLIYRPLRAAR